MRPSTKIDLVRLLRQSRLVAVRRSGRNAFYRLYDHHVRDLLVAIRHHHEPVEPPEPVTLPPERLATGR